MSYKAGEKLILGACQNKKLTVMPHVVCNDLCFSSGVFNSFPTPVEHSKHLNHWTWNANKCMPFKIQRSQQLYATKISLTIKLIQLIDNRYQMRGKKLIKPNDLYRIGLPGFDSEVESFAK